MKSKIITSICGVVICVSAVQIASDFYVRYNENSMFESLAAEMRAVQTERENPNFLGEVSTTTKTYTPDDNNNGILDKFETIYDKNSDFTGWLSINNTNVNYPVMITPENPEFYLRSDFEKNPSTSGVPFIGDGCSSDPESSNIIIYGHNMVNGTMFRDLLQYKNENFYGDHAIIDFSTLSDDNQYEIMSIFVEDTTIGNGHFEFYNFTDFQSEADYEEFISTAKSRSLYDTGVDAEFGDKFLTLVTCEKTRTTNGRLVIIAVKK